MGRLRFRRGFRSLLASVRLTISLAYSCAFGGRPRKYALKNLILSVFVIQTKLLLIWDKFSNRLLRVNLFHNDTESRSIMNISQFSCCPSLTRMFTPQRSQ